MKYILLSFLLIAALLSCKKQYTCSCRATIEATDSVDTHEYRSTVVELGEAMTRKQGEAACEHEAAALRTTYRNIYGSSSFTTTEQGWKTPEVECTLK